MNPLNNSRGQVAVLYALLVPVLLFLGGVGLDLGWYYLNVSRLQNSADAAVLVGADKLIEIHTQAFENYKVALVDKFPANNPVSDIDISVGNVEAFDYAKKNLAYNSDYAPPSLFSVAYAEDDTTNFYTLTDSYTRGNPTITMRPSLYKDDDNNYYYVLHLTENIHHLFIGFLGDMQAPVVAVAKISKDATSDSDVVPKVVFDANGGQINKSDGGATSTAELGELDKKFPVTIKLPDGYEQIPTREGYRFDRWSLTQDGSGKDVYGTDIYTEDDLKKFFETYDPNSGNAGYNYKKDGVVTLYAVWVKIQEEKPDKKQPKVIFDANGGKYSDDKTTASKDFKAASEMEDGEVSEPLTPSKGVPTNGSK
ncbi:MAG: InlB B-repeat-containing protein, partial [Quinella sp. 1Q5]|nr:InlB B-repeat-containing protein [Quinella sp. 1Q5]